MAILISDSFNRANSTTTLGTTDSYNGGTQKTWIPQEGTWGISTNRAYLEVEPANYAIAVVQSDVSNAIIEVDVIFSAGTSAGLTFRNTSNSDWLDAYISSSGLVLRKLVSWTSTTISTYSFTPVNGTTYRIKATLNGNSIIISLNGTQRISVTDSFNSTATLHGIRNPIKGSYFDNFTVSDLSTGGIVDAGTIVLSADSSLTSIGSLILNSVSSLAGDSVLSVDGMITSGNIVMIDLSADTNLNAIGTNVINAGSISLSVESVLDSIPTISYSGISSLSAETNLSIISDVVSVSVTIDLSAGSDLVSNGSIVLNAGSVLSAETNLNFVGFLATDLLKQIVNHIYLEGGRDLSIRLNTKQSLNIRLNVNRNMNVRLKGGFR